MKTKVDQIVSTVVILLLVFILLMVIYSNYTNILYEQDMFVLLLSFIPFSIIFLGGTSFNKVKILHPFGLVSVLYLLIFIFAPMILISVGDVSCHGDDVMEGCSRGTLYFLLSYLFFCIGYSIIKVSTVEKTISKENSDISSSLLSFLMIIIVWSIGCFCCCYYIYKSSLAFVFLLGDNESIMQQSNSGLKFLASFAYFMIFPCLMLPFVCKRKIIYYPIIAITLLLFCLRGTRIFLMILLLAFIIIYVRRRNIKIRTKHILVGLFAFICMITAVGSNRTNVKSGGENSMSFTTDDIANTMVTNFDIYKPYYGLVANCPHNYDYSFGKGIFYDSAITLIPRILWKNKPEESDAAMVNAIKNTTGYGPLSARMSWPCIAEFYMDFGVLGVIVFSLIGGMLMKKSIRLLNSSRILDVMAYAVLFPTFFQLVIRGYTPINLIMYICLFLPYFIIKPVLIKKRRR